MQYPETSTPTPSTYSHWSLLLQCISGAEHVDDLGRRSDKNTRVRNLSFPPNLVGMSALRGTINIYGHADMGYEVRVRGRFPSKQQTNFLVLRSLDSSREHDYWIGADVEPPSLEVHARSMWHEHGQLPSPEEVVEQMSLFEQIDPQDEKAFAELLCVAASKRHPIDTPLLDTVGVPLR